MSEIETVNGCLSVKDYGPDAQAAAEKHIMECYVWLNDDGPEPELGFGGPFCGCETCDVRETLYAAYSHLAKQVYANLAYDLRDLTNGDRPKTGVDSLFAIWLDGKIKEMGDSNST